MLSRANCAYGESGYFASSVRYSLRAASGWRQRLPCRDLDQPLLRAEHVVRQQRARVQRPGRLHETALDEQGAAERIPLRGREAQPGALVDVSRTRRRDRGLAVGEAERDGLRPRFAAAERPASRRAPAVWRAAPSRQPPARRGRFRSAPAAPPQTPRTARPRRAARRAPSFARSSAWPPACGAGFFAADAASVSAMKSASRRSSSSAGSAPSRRRRHETIGDRGDRPEQQAPESGQHEARSRGQRQDHFPVRSLHAPSLCARPAQL